MRDSRRTNGAAPALCTARTGFWLIAPCVALCRSEGASLEVIFRVPESATVEFDYDVPTGELQRVSTGLQEMQRSIMSKAMCAAKGTVKAPGDSLREYAETLLDMDFSTGDVIDEEFIRFSGKVEKFLERAANVAALAARGAARNAVLRVEGGSSEPGAAAAPALSNAAVLLDGDGTVKRAYHDARDAAAREVEALKKLLKEVKSGE